jgi:hypothetical protein
LLIKIASGGLWKCSPTLESAGLFYGKIAVIVSLPPLAIAIFIHSGLADDVGNFFRISDVVQGFFFPAFIFYDEVGGNVNFIASNVRAIYRHLFRLFFDALGFIGYAIARIGSGKAIHGLIVSHYKTSLISTLHPVIFSLDRDSRPFSLPTADRTESGIGCIAGVADESCPQWQYCVALGFYYRFAQRVGRGRSNLLSRL